MSYVVPGIIASDLSAPPEPVLRYRQISRVPPRAPPIAGYTFRLRRLAALLPDASATGLSVGRAGSDPAPSSVLNGSSCGMLLAPNVRLPLPACTIHAARQSRCLARALRNPCRAGCPLASYEIWRRPIAPSAPIAPRPCSAGHLLDRGLTHWSPPFASPWPVLVGHQPSSFGAGDMGALPTRSHG